MRNKIVEMLISRGYDAELKTVTKNNVKLDAVVMGSGTIRPTIYIDSIIENCTDVDKVADRIIEIYESNINPSFDLDKILSRDFIAEHITIALQKVSDIDIVKKTTEFEGIEQYLLVQDKDFSYKLTKQALNTVGIDVTEAWDIAMDNLIANTILKPLNEVLAEITENPLFFSDDCNITIISNTKRYNGAAAILNKSALRSYAENNKLNRFFIIPSSIHECLLVPYNEDLTLDLVTGFLREINKTVVDDIDVLSNYVYEIKIESDCWRISYGK